MKWALISTRSTQETKQRFVSTWSQIWPNSVEIFFNCSNHSAPLCATPKNPTPYPPIPIAYVLFWIIGMILIGIIFGNIFGGFNNVFNGLNNEYKLECGGALLLNAANTTNTNSATGVAIRTTINLTNSGVGLGLKNEFGPAQIIATTYTATTIVTNKNRNIFYGETAHKPTPPVTDNCFEKKERESTIIGCSYYNK